MIRYYVLIVYEDNDGGAKVISILNDGQLARAKGNDVWTAVQQAKDNDEKITLYALGACLLDWS